NCSPVLLEMNVPFYFDRRLIDLEPPALEDLDDAQGGRVGARAGLAVDGRDADHLRVAAQVDVGAGRVERLAQPLLQLAAGDQVLDVHLLADRVGLARGQGQVDVVRVTAHQLLLDGQVAEVALVAHAAGRQDAPLVPSAQQVPEHV